MPINPNRILADLEAFAAISSGSGGAGGGGGGEGVTRLALSPEDREARGLFARLAGEVGLALRIDRFGNMWSRTAHDSWDVPTVVAGSHLDSVPAGGRFDGVVGIVAGLEAIRAISEDGRLPAVPLGVVNFTAEESSRYGIATVGSKAVAGLLAPEEVMALKDRHGTTYAEALSNYGGFDLTGAVFLPPGPVGCYLEMHVEQGKELEIAEMPLGVVKAIAAPTRFRVTVHGEAAHSGATLMTWRKDGLVAASELVLALERIAELEDEYGTVATATIFALHPVSINVVPGRVELGVDIRGIDSGSKHRAVERFHRTVRRVSAQRGILIETELLADEEPVALHPDAVECVRLGCERAGLPHMMMQSRAGHDAMNMLHVCPAGMLFVPSRGGISHHPAEYTSMEHIVQGAAALMEAMLAAAAMVQRRQAQGGGSGR